MEKNMETTYARVTLPRGEDEPKAKDFPFGYVSAGMLLPPADMKPYASPGCKIPVGPEPTAVCLATAKAVLEQSHEDFLPLLNCLEGPSDQTPEQQPDKAAPVLTCATEGPGSSADCGASNKNKGTEQQERESPDLQEHQWRRSTKTKKGRRSCTAFPVSPGLVSTVQRSCASCLQNPKEAVQEKLHEFHESASEKASSQSCQRWNEITFSQVYADKKQKGVAKTRIGAGKEVSIAGSLATDDCRSTSQKETGRFRIRITPQQFSPLGTSFRDVQVDFFPNCFTIRAIDCGGYAWTAHSSVLPGRLDTGKSKFIVSPTGTDVVISLCKADCGQSWKELTRLELTRPYGLPGQGSS